MAFDGAFLKNMIQELNEGVDCHVDKIYQPSKDELVFLLRKKGFAKRLLITVKNGSARIHWTDTKFENPDIPPNFCMLLRKYLSAARLICVTQPELERIVELKFSATNEMGDIVILTLVCEFIGGKANVILLREDGRILDALKKSDVESATRYILPGAVYQYPDPVEKLTLSKNNIPEICLCISEKQGELSERLLATIAGLSPLICREIACRLQEKGPNFSASSLAEELNRVARVSIPTLLLSEKGQPADFTFMPITQYGNTRKCVTLESYSALLDKFFAAKDMSARLSAASHDITRLVNNLIARTEKKLALRLNELKKCEDRETFRIYGELLKANLHAVKAGSESVTVPNYYSEDLALITIPLNPALSPSKNAERYFKEYKKTWTAEQTLTALTKQDAAELEYFESVKESISRCGSLSDVEEIRQELISGGYLKVQKTAKKAKNPTLAFKEYKSPEGFKTLVGKNNLQNDYITTRLSSKGDMWFHVKNIHGSHVVVFCDGAPISDETVLWAAALAAKNSKAAESSNVPVDYTPIKFVKKPSGAKPGMVIYTTNKTVFVTPKEFFEEEIL